MNPYDVVRQFEAALCEYTGAPFCVTTTSCTSALLLACAWHLRGLGPIPQGDHVPTINIPRFTYIGVAMSIVHAGGWPMFRDEQWEGVYRLSPLPVWDSARWLSRAMWAEWRSEPRDSMACLSMHPTKHLGLSNGGGAILHDDPEADEWLRRARFDGRKEGVAPKDDTFSVLGYHVNMMPPTAAEGLLRLSSLPVHNEPLPWGPGTSSDYVDLSELECFR